MPDPEQTPDDEDHDAKDAGRLTFFQIVSSTVAAAFGVQSRRNRERDFNRGKPIHFIVAGIVFTVLFVLTILLIVNVVLA